MKKGKFKFNKNLILFLVITSLLIYWVYTLLTGYIKQSNIYNVDTMEFTDIKINTNGLLVFDEYVYDTFDNTTINIDPDKIIRNGESVDETISVQANSNATSVENYLLAKRLINRDDTEDDEIEEASTLSEPIAKESSLVKAIQSNNIKTLNIDFLDTINEKDLLAEVKIQEIDSFIKNKYIMLDKSGYMLTKLDGYETLINKSNIDKFDADMFDITKLEEEFIPGLKYMSNKNYQIIAKIDNYDKYEDFNFSSMTLEIDKKELLISSYEILRDKYNNVYIIFQMNEGLDSLKDKRIINLNINLGRINTLKIPNKTIISKGDQTGVYTLINGIVRFAPVKVITIQDDYSLIRHRKEDIFSQAYLQLVDRNNSRFNYDVSNPNYINIYELQEFSKIILNPENLKEGVSY